MNNKQCNGIVHVKEHMREGHKVGAYDRKCGRHNDHPNMINHPYARFDNELFERVIKEGEPQRNGNIISEALTMLLRTFWAIKDGNTLSYLQAINAILNTQFFQVFVNWINQFGISPTDPNFKLNAAEFLSSEEGQAQMEIALQSQSANAINYNYENVTLPVSDISNNIVISESVSSKYANMDDVIKLKGALIALGYYDAPKDKKMSPFFDDNLTKAISMYQKDMGLPVTGFVTPDSPMIDKINERLSFYPDGPRFAAIHAFLGNNSKFEAYNAQRGKSMTGVAAPLKHMIKNYKDLKEAKTKGADKYFHCKGNYQAATYGAYGKMLSQLISFGKELKDIPQYAMNDGWIKSFKDTLSDWEANKSGWDGASSGKSLFESCEQYRPMGLSKKY